MLVVESATRQKAVLILIVSVCIAFNLYTFVLAYPETTIINSGCCANQDLAKDFSAYYTAAWRFTHDPSNLYTPGSLHDGGPRIFPSSEPFKYLPSFLIFIFPLLVLSYQKALLVFDVLQFLLLPAMAFLISSLLKGKGILTVALVMVIAILQPSPIPHWGLSASYFWQWAEGQDKVLNAVLLLLSFYLGQAKRPALSGIVLALGSFDIRFFLLSLPLFVLYNRNWLKAAGVSLCVSLMIFNLPVFFSNIGVRFVHMALSEGIKTPLYFYGYIPLLTLFALMVVNREEFNQMARSMTKQILPANILERITARNLQKKRRSITASLNTKQ
ncbi:MAG: hypothetical protein ACREBS_07165 [Nitrososphaerales archaeon]